MSRFIDYQPIHIDEIDYNQCKWLINEVCTNENCEYVADYPYPNCKCENKKQCKYFEKEDGK